jgi:hypothetical protein
VPNCMMRHTPICLRWLGMIVQVRVLRSSMGFRPNGCVFKFIFIPMGWTRIWPTQNQVRMWVLFFTFGCTWNQKNKTWFFLKKTKTKKKSDKNLKPEKIIIYKTWWAPETRQVRIQMLDFIRGCGFRCQIQLGYIFLYVRFSVNPTRPIVIPMDDAGSQWLHLLSVTPGCCTNHTWSVQLNCCWAQARDARSYHLISLLCGGAMTGGWEQVTIGRLLLSITPSMFKYLSSLIFYNNFDHSSYYKIKIIKN